MKITGHTDLIMLQKYIKVTEKIVENEVNNIWNNEPYMKVVNIKIK